MMRLYYHETVTGGTTYGWFTVYRATDSPDGVPGFHQCDLDEFQQLVPPFEDAFHARRQRMDGWETADGARFTVYKNCPLPTPEDRVLFILVYLKTYALQVVHGRLFGMVQGKANQWIHVLLPALRPRHPRRCPGLIPAWLSRNGCVLEAAAVSVPLAEASTLGASRRANVPLCP